MQILRDNRLDWKVLEPAPFQFKSDRICATFEKSCDDDWHAIFIGASEVCTLICLLVVIGCRGIG